MVSQSLQFADLDILKLYSHTPIDEIEQELADVVNQRRVLEQMVNPEDSDEF